MGVAIILLCIAVVVFGHQLMVGVFQFTDPKIHGDAVAYLLITGTAGIFFSTINQVFTGIYTGIGDSKTPFLATALGLILNLIFDPVLIFGIGPDPRDGRHRCRSGYGRCTGRGYSLVFGNFQKAAAVFCTYSGL